MASSTSAYVRERANRSPSDSSVPRTSPLVRIACTPTSRAGTTMREKPKSSLRWRVTVRSFRAPLGKRKAPFGGIPYLLAAESDFWGHRSEEHTSELQSQSNLVCRLLLEKK